MDESLRKQRALRKYEADETAVPGLGDGLSIFSPFGPMIGRQTLPPALIDTLNAFADGHVCAGEGREFLVPQAAASVRPRPDCPSLTGAIRDAIERFVLASERGVPSSIVIERIWIVSQYAGTPSPVHFHSGDLSGVLYLKAPEPPSPAELSKSYVGGRQAGFINFMTAGKQAFSKSIMSFPPEVGTFYVFPAWLLHGAEPFRGAGERRSLSFNARVVLED